MASFAGEPVDDKASPSSSSRPLVSDNPQQPLLHATAQLSDAGAEVVVELATKKPRKLEDSSSDEDDPSELRAIVTEGTVVTSFVCCLRM